MKTTPPVFAELDLYILLAVLRLRDDAYGVRIAAEVAEAQGREVSTSAIYAALDRLAGRGMVTSTLGEATPERGGRAKRYFRVTEQGVAALHQAKASLSRLWRFLPAQKGNA